MKTLFISALVLFGSLASAAPHIGDMITFDVTVTSTDNKAVVGVIGYKLTDYDDSAKMFLREVTEQVGSGTPQVTQDIASESELPGDEFLNSVIAKCTELGGTPETITTGKGDMAACKADISNANVKGFQWYGAVPFAVMKADYTILQSNTHIAYVLKDFAFGK